MAGFAAYEAGLLQDAESCKRAVATQTAGSDLPMAATERWQNEKGEQKKVIPNKY